MTPRLIRRIRARVRDWYAGRTDAFKAAWVTAWIAFVARVAVPIVTLSDNLASWIEGTGDPIILEQLVSAGRTFAGAAYGLAAFGINYVLRTYRPNAVYLTGAGSTIRNGR